MTPFYKSDSDPAFNPFVLYNFNEPDRSSAQYVSDVIGEDYKDWEKWGVPIFISAQTGKRKTSFIEKVLLPHIHDANGEGNFISLTSNGVVSIQRKALIVSNRIALSLQMKSRLVKNPKLKDVIDLRDDILKQSDFGLVTILSYQNLHNRMGTIKSKEYTHVIFDECHFFTSDAMFNPYTGLILETVTGKFHHAVRVYMSATMGDCLRYICDYELKAYNLIDDVNSIANRKELMCSNSLCFRHYKLGLDYSYLNIKSFSNHVELIELIKSNRDKWLIFIDNIDECRSFKKELIADKSGEIALISGEIMVINARSKDNKNYQQMLANEEIPDEVRVLITTSVIDNGVSFGNKDLKNVVIADIDKVKCMQLVGRKRINPDWGEDYKFNLYIKTIGEEELERRLDLLKKQKEAYFSHDDAYVYSQTKSSRNAFYHRYYNGNWRNFENAKHWFYRSGANPERVLPNDIAYSFVDTLLKRYSSILDEMKNSDSKREYIDYQFSWFEKSSSKSYDEKNDRALIYEAQSSEEFDRFIESIRERALSPNPVILKNEKPVFKENFKMLYIKVYGRRKSGRDFGMHTINKIFAELNTGLHFAERTRTIDRKNQKVWLIELISPQKRGEID